MCLSSFSTSFLCICPSFPLSPSLSLYSKYNFPHWIQSATSLFHSINVCFANALIISIGANRIDNYTLYTEALPHLFVFLSFPPTAPYFYLPPTLSLQLLLLCFISLNLREVQCFFSTFHITLIRFSRVCLLLLMILSLNLSTVAQYLSFLIMLSIFFIISRH